MCRASTASMISISTAATAPKKSPMATSSSRPSRNIRATISNMPIPRCCSSSSAWPRRPAKNISRPELGDGAAELYSACARACESLRRSLGPYRSGKGGLRDTILKLGFAESTILRPSLRAQSAWWGGVGGGGWMPRERQRPVDNRVPRARALRRDATEAEKKLWRYLRQPPFKAHHFRRQATIGPYFADFASHQAKIVVEVDGSQHAGST